MILVSQFRSFRDPAVSAAYDSLEDLLTDLASIERTLDDSALSPEALELAYAKAKDASTAWSPATPFEGTRASENASANVLVYDFDGLTDPEADRLFARLRPYRAVAHSSSSHLSSLRQGLQAWRVVVELAESVSGKAAYRQSWMDFRNSTFEDLPVDESSSQLTRKYYYGLTLASNADAQSHWVSPGLQRPEPSTVVTPAPQPASLPVTRTEVTKSVRDAARALRQALEARLPPRTGQRHDFRQAAAGMLLRTGWSIEASSEIVFEADPSRDASDCRNSVVSTAIALAAGGFVSGIPRLEELTGPAVRPFLQAVGATGPRPKLAPRPPPAPVAPAPPAPRAVGNTAPAPAPAAPPDPVEGFKSMGELLSVTHFLSDMPGLESPEPEPAPSSPNPNESWDMAEGGRVRNTQRNLLAALRQDFICWTDVLKSKEYIRPRSGGQDIELHQGSVPSKILDRLANHYRLSGVTMKEIYSGLTELAAERRVDPLADYLRALPTWAGERPAVLPDLVRGLANQSTDPRLARRQVYRWLIATYLRGVTPGTQHPTVLCLHGSEGTGKSSFLKALANGDSEDQFFTDAHHSISHPEVKVQSSEYWISEWPEAEMLQGSNYNLVKAFLTSTADTFRRPYDVKAMVKPRRTAIALTTNDLQILPAEVEARRFYVMKNARFPAIAWTAGNRDKIWAEIKGLVAVGLRGSLNPEDARVSKKQAAEDLRSYGHGQEEIEECLTKLPNPRSVRAKDVLDQAVLEGFGAIKSLHQVSKALKALGFVKDASRWWHLPETPITASPDLQTSPTAMEHHPELFLPEDEVPYGGEIVTLGDYRIRYP